MNPTTEPDLDTPASTSGEIVEIEIDRLPARAKAGTTRNGYPASCTTP